MIGINYLGKRYERLANQMFQYAAVKGIAKNRGLIIAFLPLDIKMLMMNGQNINSLILFI